MIYNNIKFKNNNVTLMVLTRDSYLLDILMNRFDLSDSNRNIALNTIDVNNILIEYVEKICVDEVEVKNDITVNSLKKILDFCTYKNKLFDFEKDTGRSVVCEVI